MNASTDGDRLYRGTSAAERRAQRRGQFIAAAFEVYGARGYRNASVRAVCERAGLTERYFYESFPNSEALLLAAFEVVCGTLLEAVCQAGAEAQAEGADRARAMLAAFFDALQCEPEEARVFLVEIGGVSPAVDAALDAALERFGLALAHALAPGRSPDPLLLVAVVGGIVRLALTWIAGGYALPLEAITDAALRLSRCLAD